MSDPLHDHRLSHAPSRLANPRYWIRHLAIVLGAAAGYFGGRVIVEGDRSTAIRNAERLLDVERRLGIDIERAAQDLVIDNDLLRAAANASYVWLHWPLLVVALTLLFLRDEERYVRLRNAMIWSGVVGLGFFTFFPVAPPRFMPGFVGTVSDDARRHYLDYPLSWTNQYAAVPSFHAGWTLIACLAVAGLFHRRLAKALVLLPGLLVTLAVVGTGNHYVIDTTLGIAIAVAAYVAVGRTRTLDGSPVRPVDPIRSAGRRRARVTTPEPGRRTP